LEKWKLKNKYPHPLGIGMEKEIINYFPDSIYPFSVVIRDDDQKNIEWFEKEKIVESVVRGAIGKRFISLQDEQDYKMELQLYLCQKIIPFVQLNKIKSLSDLIKYLKMSALHELVNRLRNSNKNQFVEFIDKDYENTDKTI